MRQSLIDSTGREISLRLMGSRHIMGRSAKTAILKARAKLLSQWHSASVSLPIIRRESYGRAGTGTHLAA